MSDLNSVKGSLSVFFEDENRFGRTLWICLFTLIPGLFYFEFVENAAPPVTAIDLLYRLIYMIAFFGIYFILAVFGYAYSNKRNKENINQSKEKEKIEKDWMTLLKKNLENKKINQDVFFSLSKKIDAALIDPSLVVLSFSAACIFGVNLLLFFIVKITNYLGIQNVIIANKALFFIILAILSLNYWPLAFPGMQKRIDEARKKAKSRKNKKRKKK